MKKTPAQVAHETAKGLLKAGIISMKTMQEFDKLCLPEIQLQQENRRDC